MKELHVKLEFDESLNAKKELLYSQISLLNIARKIESYKELRNQELDKKASIRTKIKQANILLKKLKANMPKMKLEEEKEEFKQKVIEKSRKSEIEHELRGIQEKLARLG